MHQKWITSGINVKDLAFAQPKGAFHFWGDKDWKQGSTMTVSLNMHQGIVEFFCDGERLQRHKLKMTEAPFYFALSVGRCDANAVFESGDCIVSVY